MNTNKLTKYSNTNANTFILFCIISNENTNTRNYCIHMHLNTNTPSLLNIPCIDFQLPSTAHPMKLIYHSLKFPFTEVSIHSLPVTPCHPQTDKQPLTNPLHPASFLHVFFPTLAHFMICLCYFYVLLFYFTFIHVFTCLFYKF